jgi:hypothetical protein
MPNIALVMNSLESMEGKEEHRLRQSKKIHHDCEIELGGKMV